MFMMLIFQTHFIKDKFIIFILFIEKKKERKILSYSRINDGIHEETCGEKKFYMSQFLLE